LRQSRYSLIRKHWPNRLALLADWSACYPRYKLENRAAGGSMRFGFFDQLPCAPGYSEQQRFQDIIAQIELGDRVGFDTVWLGELHFSRGFSISRPAGSRSSTTRFSNAVSDEIDNST